MSPTVIGIDASLSRTALASTGDCVDHLVIETGAAQPIASRLRHLSDHIFRALRDWPGDPALVVMEEPGFVPRHLGVQAIYAVGRAQGAVLVGLPAALRVEIVGVSTWRRDLGIKMVRGAGKQPVIDYVERSGITVPPRGRGRPDDDVADAYALALWGMTSGLARATG